MKETVSLRIDKKIMDVIRAEAQKEYRSVNNYIEILLIKHVESLNETKNPSQS